MILDQHDRRSATWRKLETYLLDRQDMLRKQNDVSLPLDKTQKLRGRIAEIRTILDLAGPDEQDANAPAEEQTP